VRTNSSPSYNILRILEVPEMTKALAKDGTVKTISSQTASEETPPRSIHDLETLIGEKLGKHTIQVYRGVVIFWADKPSDAVLQAIDDMRAAYRGRLVLLRLQDGALSLAWRGKVPEDLDVGGELQGTSEGSPWTVERSTQVA
jgi:hypothetical protein